MGRARLKFLLLILCALCLALSGCAAQEKPAAPQATAVPTAAVTEAPAAAPSAAPTAGAERQSAVGYYFDTVVTLTAYGADEALLGDIWAMCTRYEQLLSKTIAGSDVSRVNTAMGQTVTVDQDTWDILREAKVISEQTEHAFSISIAPLTAMWDFTGGTQRMPTDVERLAALPLVDDDAIVLGEKCTVTLPAGMQIDLGGIAKGYIADRIAEMARGRCMGLVLSLGGNTYAVGRKPNGSRWGIGIQDPVGNQGESMGVISLDEGTVVTSGIYERYFMIGDVRYHHILDPKNGLPADTDLASVSIVCHNSMQADALATACVVHGSEKALRLLGELGLDALLITREGEVLQTEGFAEKYSFQRLK